jgi:hypothetical protein
MDLALDTAKLVKANEALKAAYAGWLAGEEAMPKEFANDPAIAAAAFDPIEEIRRISTAFR